MQVGPFLSLFDCQQVAMALVAAAIVDTPLPPSSSFFFSSFLPLFFNSRTFSRKQLSFFASR